MSEAKELPPPYLYKAEDYPEYENYFVNYRERLSKDFQPKNIFKKPTKLYVQYDYKITKDGKIEDFRLYDSSMDDYEYSYLIQRAFRPLYWHRIKVDSKRFEEYVKKIIFDNPPKVFPEGVEYDKYRLEVFFAYIPGYKGDIEEDLHFSYKETVKPDGWIIYSEWQINIYVVD